MVTIVTNSAGEQIAMIVGEPSSPGAQSECESSLASGDGHDDDEDPFLSSPSSMYNMENDSINTTMENDVTAQLAASGPIGVAAAAAIISSRKRHYSFETNPTVRRRQKTRLLRKLRQTIDEFTTRVGQQAVILIATPEKSNMVFKVFGAKPLEYVIKNLKSTIVEGLENALAQHTPPPVVDDPALFELPPLVIDGIPTPVERMTQAQLRAFIPLMLKYSSGRGKPGWGRSETRPPWWPKEFPWANVRVDARTESEKQKISWTHALRQIVINCYKHHGREDLLPAFSSDEEPKQNVQEETMLQTITNSDGSISILQVDSENPIITLPDGTMARVQRVTTCNNVLSSGNQSQVIEANLDQNGQFILRGDDGQNYPVTVSGVITVPVSASVYQNMITNIQQIHTSDGTTINVTQIDSDPKIENSDTGNDIDIKPELMNVVMDYDSN